MNPLDAPAFVAAGWTLLFIAGFLAPTVLARRFGWRYTRIVWGLLAIVAWVAVVVRYVL